MGILDMLKGKRTSQDATVTAAPPTQPTSAGTVGLQVRPSGMLPFVHAPEGEKPVELQGLDITVVVTGLLAETTQTMRFFNPNARVLEGNLTFPLPDNAAVSGYALDVKGVMVDGVVVPKQEARRILEAEERKGIDPGIVEQVQGNIYRTRLYPIPARGVRTVKLTYVSDLTVAGEEAAYHLPLGHADRIDSVSLRIEVVQTPVTPQLSGGIGNLSLNRWRDSWVAEARLGKGTPANDLQVRLPNLPEQFTAVEKTESGEVFFCLSRKLPAQAPSAWRPQRLAIAWDASGSRTGIERDLAFLKTLIAAWPGLVADVLVFRDQVENQTKTFSIRGDDAEPLLTYFRDLAYDGGTDLTALDFSAPPDIKDEAWLLFSDGLGTMKPGLPQNLARRIIAVTSQPECNSALLKHLADESGGAYINLLRTPDDVALQAISGIQDFLAVIETSGVEDVHLAKEQDRLSIFGRLMANQGTITLGGPNAPAGNVHIAADAPSSGKTLARAWAGRETQKISVIEGDRSPKLLALGRKYELVTPNTSLLVLETLAQYIEYDIEPPASLPSMVEEFRAHRVKRDKEEETRKTKQIETVLSLWQRRIAWWERDFSAERENSPQSAKQSIPPTDDPEAVRMLTLRRMRQLEAEMDIDASPLQRQRDLRIEEREMRSVGEMDAPIGFAVGGIIGAPAAGLAEGAEPQPRSAHASVSIQPWSPDTPYLQALRQASQGQAYAVYLAQRARYARSPAFFLDCGDHFLSAGEHALGIRILSNLLELGLDDAALLRMFAWRLQQAEELDLAVSILERVRRDRDDEPQSHRDLALALGLRWERSSRPDDITRAMELLYDVVLRSWDRFPEIEVIALIELNRLIYLSTRKGISVPERIDLRLRRPLDLDVRISMSWDADLTDVDLHVFEPTGDHAYYRHNLTNIGGLVSRDFTRGYGPEEYVLRKAPPGVYTIKAHYYGSTQQTKCGPCTVTATVFTNYGRDDEQKQIMMLRLEKPSNEVLIGQITIAGEQTEVPEPEPGDAWRKSFKTLVRGMTVNEITAIVGQPAELTGETEIILIYRPVAGVLIHIHTAPTLVSVEQIIDGGTLTIV
jgi:Ca-activated chloride channel homolog